MDDELKKKTQETAKRLFGKGIKMDPPYLTWKEFDRGLANDFSLFITGKLYSRTVLTLPERQMVACAMLAALHATELLKEFFVSSPGFLEIATPPGLRFY